MAVRTNYIPNPSFEASATTGWSVADSGAAVATVTQVTGGQVGTYAREIVYTVAAAESGKELQAYSSQTAAGTAAVGEQWNLSCYAKLGASHTGTMNIALRIYQYADSTGTGNQDSTFTPTTEWQRFNHTFTVTGATTNRLRGAIQVSALDTGDVLDIITDGWLLEKVATVGDYFDGDTTDTGSITYDWTGTANNSASTATDVVAPTVVTAPVSNITASSATSGGTITSEGTASVTAYGVCWNTTGTPTTADSKTTQP